MSTLTLQELQAQLAYDPYTGRFVWTQRRKGRRPGKEPGSLMANGYRAIRVSGKDYLAHRLAWFLMHAQWPNGNIDHINGDRSDNRLCNLRDVDQSANMQNLGGPRKDNSTGYLGVSVHYSGKFTARITVGGKYKSLGLFRTAEEAHEAYVHAKRQYHPASARHAL